MNSYLALSLFLHKLVDPLLSQTWEKARKIIYLGSGLYRIPESEEQIGKGITLRREWLMLTLDGFMNTNKSFFGCPHWLHSPSSYVPECVGEWNFHQVAGFGVSNKSWTRRYLWWGRRLYRQDPQAASKSYESDSGELLYTIHILQALGGMEVGRVKLSSKWDIQPSSFRNVYSQTVTMFTYLSPCRLTKIILWFSGEANALRSESTGEKKESEQMFARFDWFQVWSKWVSIIHHKPITIADFHRILH